MMKRALLVALLALGAAACRQGLGQPCQVSSDCKSGLYCVLPVGGTPESGGKCQTADGPDLSSDMPLEDLSFDDGGEEDAGRTFDFSSADQSEVD